MDDARTIFDLEFDSQPRPVLDFKPPDQSRRVWSINVDREDRESCPADHHQAFTLWLRSRRFASRRERIARLIRQVLNANPFTTLQIVFDLTGCELVQGIEKSLPVALLQTAMAACQESSSYLDRYYAIRRAAARGQALVLLLPVQARATLSEEWLDSAGELTTLVWLTGGHHVR